MLIKLDAVPHGAVGYYVPDGRCPGYSNQPARGTVPKEGLVLSRGQGADGQSRGQHLRGEEQRAVGTPCEVVCCGVSDDVGKFLLTQVIRGFRLQVFDVSFERVHFFLFLFH